MQEYAKIKYNLCSLKTFKNIKVLPNPRDPNDVNSTEIIWTNELEWKTAETQLTSYYETVAPTTVTYVKYFQVGIVHAKTSLKHVSGKGK